MQELKIHAEGEKDHMKAVKEKYARLKKSLKMTPKLNSEEKQVELKKLDEQAKKDKYDSKQSLF